MKITKKIVAVTIVFVGILAFGMQVQANMTQPSRGRVGEINKAVLDNQQIEENSQLEDKSTEEGTPQETQVNTVICQNGHIHCDGNHTLEDCPYQHTTCKGYDNRECPYGNQPLAERGHHNAQGYHNNGNTNNQHRGKHHK